MKTIIALLCFGLSLKMINILMHELIIKTHTGFFSVGFIDGILRYGIIYYYYILWNIVVNVHSMQCWLNAGILLCMGYYAV